MTPHLTLTPETLELLGLTRKDMDVYVVLLKLGTAPLRRIALSAGLNRGTAYDALNRLISAGLASHVDSKTHRYFIGEDPQKLRGLATRREVAIREARLDLEPMIPFLQALVGASEHRPSVRYYEGESGVRDILEDVLATAERAESKRYHVYSSAGIRDLIAAAWPNFTRERIRRKIIVKAIATGKGGETAGLDERKWLNQDKNAPTYIFVYGGKTAYVSVDASKRLFGVIIEDAAIAATQKMIFQALWNRLS